MATPKPPLSVVRSPTALNELHGIWRWNVERYGLAHADVYVALLERAIDVLGEAYNRGRPVAGRPDLRYIIVRRKAKGHGHVVAYRVDEQHVNILHVFHTAQNWQEHLAE
ncbi:MAG: type II toxin-antitoxin system RelE/ParE family toxin [Planctomycetes bacterium]|nr:type II toxin-antitoxin system RelE/ParE family toxin [Planctomycetota bacterium]